MDRSWMKYPYKAEYIDGLNEFLSQAQNHLDPMGRTRCPCTKCKNAVFRHIEETNPETNEQPNDIELYRFTHQNLEKGWVAPRAEENYDRMVEVSTQPTEGGEPLTADGAREVVLGKRPGYACGLGYGVLAPRHAAETVAAARVEMDAMRQRAEFAENQLLQLTDQHHQLTDQQVVQQRQIEYLMSRIGGQPNAP